MLQRRGELLLWCLVLLTWWQLYSLALEERQKYPRRLTRQSQQEAQQQSDRDSSSVFDVLSFSSSINGVPAKEDPLSSTLKITTYQLDRSKEDDGLSTTNRFGGFISGLIDDASNAVDSVTDAASNLTVGGVLDSASDVAAGVVDTVTDATSNMTVDGVLDSASDVAGGVVDTVTNATSNMTVDGVLDSASDVAGSVVDTVTGSSDTTANSTNPTANSTNPTTNTTEPSTTNNTTNTTSPSTTNNTTNTTNPSTTNNTTPSTTNNTTNPSTSNNTNSTGEPVQPGTNNTTTEDNPASNNSTGTPTPTTMPGAIPARVPASMPASMPVTQPTTNIDPNPNPSDNPTSNSSNEPTTDTSTSPDVHVVLLAGQFNCAGMADQNHFNELLQSDDKFRARYGQFGNSNNTNKNHSISTNVIVVFDGPDNRGGLQDDGLMLHGPLRPTFGFRKDRFGIEMGLGYQLSQYFGRANHTTLLIVKFCESTPLLSPREEWKPPNGVVFRRAIDMYDSVLNNIHLYLPSHSNTNPSNTTSYELTSLVWFHSLDNTRFFDPDIPAVSNINQTLMETEIGYVLDGFRDHFASSSTTNKTNNSNLTKQQHSLQTIAVIQAGGSGIGPKADVDEIVLRHSQACVVEARAPENGVTGYPNNTTNPNNPNLSNNSHDSIIVDSRYGLVVTTTITNDGDAGDARKNENAIHYYGRADYFIAIGEETANVIIELLNGSYTPTTLCGRLSGSDGPPTITPTTYPFDTPSSSSWNGTIAPTPTIITTPTQEPKPPITNRSYDYFLQNIVPRLIDGIRRMFGLAN